MKKKFRWKIILFILILIIGLIYTGYVYKNELINNLENDILGRIEKNYEIKLNFSEIKLWPFNQLIIEDLTIKKEDKIVFSGSELKIYYDIIDIIKDGRNFKFNNLDKSLNYVEINNADINLIDFDSSKKSSLGSSGDLVKNLAGIEIIIFNSNLKSKINNYNFSLKKMDAELEFTDNQVLVKNKSDLKINEINFRENQLKNINFPNLEFKLTLAENNNWEAEIKSNYFNLAPFNDVIAETESLANINKNVKNIKGNIKANINISGVNTQINNYKSHLKLNNISFMLKEKKLLLENKIDKVNGDLFISSAKNKVTFDSLNFSFGESDFKLKGNYNFGDQSINGSLNSYNLALTDLENVFSEVKKYSPAGNARLSLDIAGSLNNPQASLEFYLKEGKFDGNKINDFRTEARYKDGLLYLDQFDISVNKRNNIMLDGIYNHYLKEYNFSLKGRKIETELINKYFENEKLQKVAGDVNLDLNISGKGFNREDFNIIGEIEMKSSDFGSAYSNIWFGRERLILDEGFWNINDDHLNFSGEINLGKEKFDLDLNGTEISIKNIKNKFEKIQDRNISNLKGKMTFEAELAGEFSSPELTGNLEIINSSFDNISLESIKGNFQYKEDKLVLDQLVLNDKDKKIRGIANIFLSQKKPRVEADLTGSNLSYKYIQQKAINSGYDQLSDLNIPLSGRLKADLKVSGHLSNPEIKGTFQSKDTSFNFAEKKIKTDEMVISLHLDKNQILEVRNFKLLKNDSEIKLAGLVSKSGYDLKYNGKNINLAKSGLSELIGIEVEALTDFSGSIEGSLKSPEIVGKLNLKNILYEENNLENLKANYSYSDGDLKLNNTIWQFAQSKFKFSGKISDVLDKGKLDLLVSTQRGNVDKVLDLFSIDPGFNIGYLFEGQAKINGNFESPSANLDFSAYSVEAKDSKININGVLNNELELNIIGSNVKLNKFINFVDSDLALNGSADFYGLISGNMSDYNLDLTTNIDKAFIEGFTANNIKGYLNYNKGSNLNLHQNFSLGGQGNISVDGKINPATMDMNLDIISKNLPLNLLEDTFEMASEVKGTANGEFTVSGNFSEPELSGELNFSGKKIDLNLPQTFSNYSGKLKFNNDYVQIADFQGKYDQAQFALDGRVYPFQRDDFWDLSLRGNSIPLDHGSFKGQFDTQEVKITGNLLKPRVKGDLLVHDFIASAPFNWPISENESAFNPQLELNLIPGQEVYFRSGRNIDVAIQKGELTLIFEDEFQMEGQLTSRQGTFDYYSNKFILDRATATFRKFDGIVPKVHIAASTLVDGVRINIRLDGPADNMIVSFTSQPDLEQKEIIALLTQKGGIAEFINKDDLQEDDVSEIIRREFMRILQGTFQLSFISDLETNLEDMLRLDRIEIDTYELGWSDEIRITAGKNITDKLYLEYINKVGVDNIENELSFSYPLTDKTRVEGSWYGDSEFSLSIDTIIDF